MFVTVIVCLLRCGTSGGRRRIDREVGEADRLVVALHAVEQIVRGRRERPIVGDALDEVRVGDETVFTKKQ